jgi:hypothetical protein
MPIIVTGEDSSMKEKPEQRFSDKLGVASKGCSKNVNEGWGTISRQATISPAAQQNYLNLSKYAYRFHCTILKMGGLDDFLSIKIGASFLSVNSVCDGP